MTITQLISHDGTPWPIYWDTAGNNIGIFTPMPRCTIEVANAHPGVQDTRLAIGNSRNDGSRGVMTISGPTDHVSFAFGGPQTGALGARFGIGNRAAYAAIMEPGTVMGPGLGQCHWSALASPGGADLTARVAALEALVQAMLGAGGDAAT